MASRYPAGFDTDVQIPRIDSNITEIGPDAINGLRDAVFAIEKILGINVQGSATDLVTRLNSSLDANGNLKASAIATLWSGSPIMNSHIAVNAGIQETKLTLNYGTTELKTWIDTLRVRVNELYRRVAIDVSNLAQHTGHPSSYGRHRTSDIDGYVGIYNGYNLQGIVMDGYNRTNDHIRRLIAAHDASAIYADDTDFFSASGNNVQEVLKSLDNLEMRELTRHRDRQHSNGILNTQETFYDDTQYGTVVVASSALRAQGIGGRFVRFVASPTGFASIQRDDTIVITSSGITYEFKVDRIETIGGIAFVYIQGSLPVGILLNDTAVIYKNTEEASSPSVLITTIKKRTASANNSVIAVHPNAPYVIGSGLNPGLLANGSIENIRIDWSPIGTYEFDLEALLPAVLQDRTPQVIVDAINTEFADNNLPLVAFLFQNEIGIALDEPVADGYVGIKAPVSNSAWAALGFTEGTDHYTLENRKSYIDGYEATNFAELINSTATIAGNVITFASTNPLSLGITIGQYIRVKNGLDDGTYEISAVAANTISVVIAGAFLGATATVRVYADSYYEVPLLRTFYETCVDVSKSTRDLYFKVIPRLRYSDNVASGQTFEEKANITAVSRNFTSSTMRIVYLTATRTLQLGAPIGLTTGLVPGTEGPAVTIPADPRGRTVRLYDNSRTAYVELQMVAVPAGANGSLDCFIEDRISEEFHLQTGTVLNNATLFLNASDNRLMGTIGRQDVRTDFIRDYTSYPLSKIRANGLIYGFLLGLQGTSVIDAYGGEALINGSVKNVDTKSIAIPNTVGAVTYNLFLDEDGEFNFLEDDSATIFSPSLEEIITSDDKVIVGQIVAKNGNFTSQLDLRRYVNNLDNKIELIVENEDITAGSFGNLQAAANWINAVTLLTFPVPKTIRIRGNLEYNVANSGATTLPDGVTLIGDGDGSNSTFGSRINVTNNTAGTSVIIPQDNCTIKNIAFEAAASSTNMINGFIGGATIDVANLKVEGCSFTYPSQNANFYGIGVDQFYGMNIKDCKFTNCGTAIINVSSGALLKISDCYFDNCLDYGIFLNYIVNANINNNEMRFSTLAATTNAIKIDSALRTYITKNIISSISTSAALAARIMISIDNASIFTKIKDNILINSTTSNQGFGLGILYGNSGTVTPFNHYYANIEGNQLQYFYGGALQKGITILRTTNSNINENRIINCRGCLDIADAAEQCTRISITNNYLETVGGGLSALRVRNTSTDKLRVIGNHFLSTEAVPTSILASMIFGGDSVVNDNIFDFANNSAYNALYFEGDDSVISNNNIWGLNFTNGTNPPVETLGLYNHVIGNKFKVGTVTAPGTALSVTGTGNTDELNKGAYYSVNIPLSNLTIDRSNAGVSSWYQVSHAAVIPNIFSTNALLAAGGGNDYAGIWFDRSFIPVGANIASVEVKYDIGVGVAADLQVGWFRRTTLSKAIATVKALANVTNPGLDQTETITPLATTYMGAQDTHMIEFFITGASGAFTLNIYGIRVNYTL